jgi:predicted O-methyltransferase YrrM
MATSSAELLTGAPAAPVSRAGSQLRLRLGGTRPRDWLSQHRLPLSGYAVAGMITLAPLWGVRSFGPAHSPSIGPFGELTLGRLLLALVLGAFAVDLVRTRSRPRPAPPVVLVFVAATVLLEAWLYVNASRWGCLSCSGSFGGFTDLVAAALLLVAIAWTFPQCRPVALGAVAASCILAACLALAGVGQLGGSASATTAGRLAGSYGNPNYLAYALSPALPILLAYRERGSRPRRIAVLIGCAVICVGLALTFSRAGLLGVAVGSITVLALQARPGARLRRAVLLGGAVAVAGVGGYPLLHEIRVESNPKPALEQAQLARSVDHSGWGGTAEGGIAGEPARMSNKANGTTLVVRASEPRTGVSRPFGTAIPGSTYTLSFEARSAGSVGTLRFGLEDNYKANGARWSQGPIGPAWRRYSVSWRPTANSPDARLYMWQPDMPAAFSLRGVRIARRSEAGTVLATSRIPVRLLGSQYVAEQRKLRQVTGAEERYYVQSRVRGARLALSAFADEPIRGIGWERFTALSLRRLPFGPLPTHDEYLRFLAELGIGGLALLLVAGAAAVAGVRSQPAGRLRIAMVGALTAAAISLLFINGLTVPSAGLWVVVVCCVAVTGYAARTGSANGATSPSEPRLVQARGQRAARPERPPESARPRPLAHAGQGPRAEQPAAAHPAGDEVALAGRGQEREALEGRAFAARAAHERVGLRLEQARVTSAAVQDRIAAGRARLEPLSSAVAGAIRDRIRARRSRRHDAAEVARFRALPREAPDASPLAAAVAGDVRFFADELPESEWPDVTRRVEPLGITDRADGVNPGDRRAIYYLVRRLRPRRVLEIGTHIGASTVHIALALAHESDPIRELVTVDIEDVNEPVRQPWKRHGSELSPRAALERAGVDSLVRFVHQPSPEFLAGGADDYDLIFLDGDHSPATVYREVPAALRRLRPGGHILLHDYFPGGRPLWPDEVVIQGPWLAIERLRGEGAPLVAMPLGRLPWATKQGTTVTSLALLAREVEPRT